MVPNSSEIVVAQTLAEATGALDFNQPLSSGHPYWCDLTEARGNRSTQRIRRLVERKPPETPLHLVFASHRGAGKSTELNRLAHDISGRYFGVYFEANIEMDANQFEMEDLLLVLARRIEQTLREELDAPLPENLLTDVEKWFSDTVLTDTLGSSYVAEIRAEAKAKGGIPFFAELLANLTSLFRVESEHREQVKSVLRKYPRTLMETVNRLLDTASARLATDADGGRELLVIIDNLDRYNPRIVDRLLVQEVDRFRQLRVNMILTPPISLLYRPQSQALDSLFQCEVMPAVKLREPSESYATLSGPGKDALLELLAKRLNLDALIPDANARSRLVAASGGSVRELLEVARDATLDASGEAIELQEMEGVLRRRQRRLRDRVDVNGWLDTLVKIGRTKRLDDDEACLQVLFQRLAFQYNGDVWYDVHPLVSEMSDFQRLWDDSGGLVR